VPRAFRGLTSLSQLSITMYRPDSAKPVANRSKSHAVQLTKSPAPSSAIVAIAAITMKLRMCPTRETRVGLMMQPVRNPRK
jgi:hypothetical protein